MACVRTLAYNGEKRGDEKLGSNDKNKDELKKEFQGFPGCLVVNTPLSQYRGPRFDPWSGN